MVLLNYSHPLLPDHLDAVKVLAGIDDLHLRSVPVQIDPAGDFIAQVRAFADEAKLSAEEWQTLPILINPPSLNIIAVALVAELHGRMGYFPPLIRLRPVRDALPPRYEVAEIVNLQAIRETARASRYG